MNYLTNFFLLYPSMVLIYGFRLPTNVIPINYTLEIISYLGIPDNFDFNGKVVIHVRCICPTGNVTLHSKNLDINEEEISVTDITNSDPEVLKVSTVEYEEEVDFLILLLEEELEQDHIYNISISFQGILADDMVGFYRSSYIHEETEENIWLAATQFQPLGARKAFPCFDEPAMKATFDISIGRMDGFKAISNMPLLHTEPMAEKEGWLWDRFDRSVHMSTYLVAFVVSDFKYKLGDPTKNNVTFRIWTKKCTLDEVDYAREFGPKLLDYFEELFNIEYVLPKQDMIALPDFKAAAMENWGLITFREKYLLYDPEITSDADLHDIALVISHEIAHQWFGNLVTMKWWNNLWLNEGFARYFEMVAVDKLHPEWNLMQEQTAVIFSTAFWYDSLMTSHPVSATIEDPEEIDTIFDAITYSKAACLIRMMDLFLGNNVLVNTLTNYLTEHKFSSVNQDDLWESLAEEERKHNILPDDLTIKTIMDTWTLQAGFPVITVTRNYENKCAEINQKRYLNILSDTDDSTDSCWWIPLTYSTREHPNFNNTIPAHWLSCPNEEAQVIEQLADENDWIIFNNNMAGLYKVNYDVENWNLIIKTLNSDEYDIIPILNREQLMSDAASLAFMGDLKYDIFFDLIKYLPHDNEYRIWKVATAKLNYLSTLSRKTDVNGLLKNFMRILLSPMYEENVDLLTTTDEFNKFDSKKLEVLIVKEACKYEYKDCIIRSQNLFKEIMENPEGDNPIPKDLREVVYCTSLKYGSEAEWRFLWNKYQTSNLEAEKDILLTSLGCTEEILLLENYLEMSLDKTKMKREEDSSKIFNAVANNDIAYDTTKNFFYKNEKIIFKDLQPYMDVYILSLANQMTENEDQVELEQFIEDNKDDFSKLSKEVKIALETVKGNIEWRRRHTETIYKILSGLNKK